MERSIDDQTSTPERGAASHAAIHAATDRMTTGLRPGSADRVVPGPGQESVWDYPRPPRIEPVPERLRVVVDAVTIADTVRGYRVLETAGAPVYYFPPEDVRLDLLRTGARRTDCEWKGTARYHALRLGERLIENVAWSYPDPRPAFEPIRDHLAFYAGLVDEAWVGDERATAQPGEFYGGWVTSLVVGPFKGEPGSFGW